MSDLEIAQNIVSRNYQNTSNGKAFHNTSVIYRTSNERICDYIEYLKNKKKMLSVIASGDQILNSILVNLSNIIYYLEYKTFQQTLNRINLNNQGTIISYLYNTESLAKRNPFNSTEIIKSNNGNHGLLLYKR